MSNIKERLARKMEYLDKSKKRKTDTFIPPTQKSTIKVNQMNNNIRSVLQNKPISPEINNRYFDLTSQIPWTNKVTKESNNNNNNNNININNNNNNNNKKTPLSKMLQKEKDQTNQLLYREKADFKIYSIDKKKTQTQNTPSSINSNQNNKYINSKQENTLDKLLSKLSKEQREVYNCAMEGNNLIFLGSAGTGKSYLITSLIHGFESQRLNVVVTASTGIAALNISGITLHKWSGVGISKDPGEQLQRAVKYTKENWKKTNVLIIDEISMVDGKILDILDKIGKYIRNSSAPFGGIQVIGAGDFFQLPPVSDKILVDSSLERGVPQYFFEAKSWKYFQKCFELKNIFRQREDQEFINLLDEVKLGKLSPKNEELLKSRLNAPLPDDGILPTLLFSRNADVDQINNQRLSELVSPKVEFTSIDTYSSNSPDYEISSSDKSSFTDALDRSLVIQKLVLKKGAQVMLIRNLSENLVNGSRGVVIDFKKATKDLRDAIDTDVNIDWFDHNQYFVTVKFSGNQIIDIGPKCCSIQTNLVVATRTQIPLKLAYALTIHKSQGLTLDKAEISLTDAFEYGQAYVALSRMKNLKSFSLKGFSRNSFKTDPKVLEFYEKLKPQIINLNPSSFDEIDNPSEKKFEKLERLGKQFQDFDSKSNEDSSSLPLCTYGSSCFRKNPQHFREFRHPHLDKKQPSITHFLERKDDNKNEHYLPLRPNNISFRFKDQQNQKTTEWIILSDYDF